MKRNLVLEFFL